MGVAASLNWKAYPSELPSEELPSSLPSELRCLLCFFFRFFRFFFLSLLLCFLDFFRPSSGANPTRSLAPNPESIASTEW